MCLVNQVVYAGHLINKLCSHTVAVAEKDGILMGFIKKYAKSSRKPNLTSLATHYMPKGRGKKATKATQRRKGGQMEWYVQ